MHVAFNQNASCCIVGTSRGFRVYNCLPFSPFYDSEGKISIQGIGLAQMLFSTSLVVLVGNGEQDSPRKLSVVNTRRNDESQILCELTFPTAIRAVRLNRQRLVVVLDSQIYIYNIANMKLLHTLDTVLNRGGVADITPLAGQGKKPDTGNPDSSSPGTISNSATGNWLVYPAGPPLKHHVAPPASGSEGSRAPQGDLIVFDLDTLSPLTVVRAHRSPLAALALNEDGTLLATTSDRGTLIRVFAIPSGTLLYEFRRGSYQSRVYSLAFSLGSGLLCVSSATQTVHIYKLDASTRLKKSKQAAGEEDDTPGASVSGSGGAAAAATVGSGGGGDDSGLVEDDVPQTEGASVPPAQSENDLNALTPPADTVTSKHKSKSKHKSRWFSKSTWTEAASLAHSNPRSRDFAWFKVPVKQNTKTVLGLDPINKLIYVATEDGKLFHFKLDTEKGGECTKLAEYVME